MSTFLSCLVTALALAAAPSYAQSDTGSTRQQIDALGGASAQG